MLRPQVCRWFELVALRDHLAAVLEALARAGAVELQTAGRATQRLDDAPLEALRIRFRELDRACRAHWPAPDRAETAAMAFDDPQQAYAQRVASLEAWRSEADPLIAAWEARAHAARELQAFGRLLALPGTLPHPDLLRDAGGGLATRIYAVERSGGPLALPADVLRLVLGDDAEDVWILVGRASEMERVDRQALGRKARRIVVPRGLQGDRSQWPAQIAQQRRDIEAQQATLQAALAALAQRAQVARLVAELTRLEWLLEQSGPLSTSERLVWVTGWTTAREPAGFAATLGPLARRCVVHFPAPPDGVEPPSLLVNGRLARAFERFAQMLGQPGRHEADPSALLAFFAPLLFGFMFGDIGQGAVLCVAGWRLRRRVPLLGLLVPGGLAAMVFGWAFGSVFAREGVVHPLWLNPLHQPVTVLAAALAIGAVILLAGLALDAAQAAWRGEARDWLLRDAGFVFAYVALLGAVLQPALFGFAALGAVWYLAGAARVARARRLAAVGVAFAQLLERGLQLLVNTLSFARVGAFALAHAGLAAAVVALADAADAVGYWIVLMLGNVLILALEGLVVGIQTTRLLLFEFFVRFLKGTGRMFRPLQPPLAVYGASSFKESR